MNDGRGPAAAGVIPEQAHRIAARLRELLGGDLVGVYLHGSFALGCGNPNGSDLDVLVVTRRGLTEAEREAFARLPMGSSDVPGWPRPLELHSLTLDQLHPWRHPAPYDLHRSEHDLMGPGEDPDLAAHVTIVRRGGVAVAGPPPEEVFPEVPRGDLVSALASDFEWCLAKRTVSPYAILSLPRIWATLAEPDALHTKETAALWARGRLPPQHRRVLELALESYRTHGRVPDVSYVAYEEYVRALVREVERLLP